MTAEPPRPEKRAGSAALIVDGVHAGYRDRAVVEGIDLRVEPGELVALIGPNGVGKTTLLRAISGGARVTAGSVRLGDVELGRLSARERARRVAVVPQAIALPFDTNVADAVLLGRTPHLSWWQGEGERDFRIALDAMRAAGIDGLARASLRRVSGGERQRVLLARALAQEPRVLLLDEATAHLDLRHQVRTLELVRQLVLGRRLAVLATFHDLNLVAAFADRAVLLDGGRVRASGTVEEVLTRDHLEAAYGCRVDVHAHPETGAPVVLVSSDHSDAR